MSASLNNQSQNQVNPKPACLSQIQLTGREVFALTPTGATIRIMAGRAWVSLGGKDVILARGEAYNLPTSTEKALISSTQTEPLVIEISKAL